MTHSHLRYASGVALVAALLLTVSLASAQVPETLSYSGFLSTAEGEPFTGEIDLGLAIYDRLEGGTALWVEDHSSDVESGWFAVRMGSEEPFGLDFASNTELWVEVTIDGETITPRQALDSVAFAMAAGSATGDLAETLAVLEAELADVRSDLDELEAATATVDWADIANVPADLADGDDFGLTEVDWDDIANVPADLADGDDVGLTAVDWDTDLVNIPADIADGDDVGLSEVDWDTDLINIPSDIADGDDTGGSVAWGDITEVPTWLADGDADWSDLVSVPTDIASFAGSDTFYRDGTEFYFEGVNVNVRNGQGFTWGAENATTSDTNSGTPNGLGNLVIGYNELASGADASAHAGSHYLVVGFEHSYTSYGGIAAGRASTASGLGAGVTGGWQNEATGQYASVSGGRANDASGLTATVCGGELNTASGYNSSVSGGRLNTASHEHASVSGGSSNVAGHLESSVSGGYGTVTEGHWEWRAAGLVQSDSPP